MRAASARSRRDGLWASPSAGDDPMGTLRLEMAILAENTSLLLYRDTVPAKGSPEKKKI